MPAEHQLEVSIEPAISRFDLRRFAARRNALFVSLIAVSVAALFIPLRHLLALSLSSDEYSYVALIPIMVLGLLFLERKKIFRDLHYSRRVGIPVVLVGMAMAAGAAMFSVRLAPDARLSGEILGLVIVWTGGFLLCYGTEAGRAGMFTLLFSLLLVPLPPMVMAEPIAMVQHGSADVTSLLFTVFGLPVFRQGLTFFLPHLTFVVATECSGIHSTTALFIAAILVGHLSSRSGWQRALLVLLVFPIVCFTNGLRMFVLATLAVYVNLAFFHGNLHHKGGTIFFALGLVILGLSAKLLRSRSRPAGQP